MSKQTAHQFLDRIEQDPVFRKELLNLSSKEERKACLKKEKLVFSEQDLTDAIQDKYHTQLTQEEMKKVIAAGGQGFPSSPEVMHLVGKLLE